MDAIFTRLEEASQMGDVDSLKRLLEEDKLLLEKVMVRTSVRDNPLHVASLLGHADFVLQIISRKPELAKEVNGQGLSPLHLAAAHGHLQVVKELLKGGLELSFAREERDGLVPLHVAVIKGRTFIVKELIEVCEAALHERTYSGATVLHLAVKSNSLDTLEFLLSRVDDLNEKDDKGNTILHLAIARKQMVVIKMLLSNPSIDVNMVNLKAFTPLDVLLESPQEYGDLVLGEIIRAAGGMTAAELTPSQRYSISSEDSNTTEGMEMSTRPFRLCRQLGFKYREVNGNENLEPRKEKKEKKYNADIIMLVAVLVATITFQGALNPPGGVNQKGKAVLSSSLIAFLAFDMIGLFGSISVILLLLCVVPRKKKFVIKFLVWVLWVATFSTALAFTVGVSEAYINFEEPLSADFQAYEYIRDLILAWLVVLMLGIVWVAIRIIIFLLKKGKLLKPIIGLFSSLMEGAPFRWLQLNGEEGTTNHMKTSTFLRKVVLVVMIFCVVGSTGLICWVVYRIFLLFPM